jgi:hypothetical protein
MRIENHCRLPQSAGGNVEQVEDTKARIVAKDIFASFPTI